MSNKRWKEWYYKRHSKQIFKVGRDGEQTVYKLADIFLGAWSSGIGAEFRRRLASPLFDNCKSM